MISALGGAMQLEKFNFLTIPAKEEAVWKYGIFIDNFSIGYLTCDIYQMFDFYVGMYYEMNSNEKAGVVARFSRDQLPPIIGLTRIEEN
ncbi:MAG TPA: hypothetical protein VEZ17_02200 [Chitinophagaceae bacterium]|jgi:hypothetical protein|nr:hypothetical protein [Chitinophagaceae bacterium]